MKNKSTAVTDTLIISGLALGFAALFYTGEFLGCSLWLDPHNTTCCWAVDWC